MRFFNVDGVTRHITSPGYPNNYQPNINYFWTLRAPWGQRISFNILNINLEYAGLCMFDYVAIYDGKEPVNPGGWEWHLL